MLREWIFDFVATIEYQKTRKILDVLLLMEDSKTGPYMTSQLYSQMKYVSEKCQEEIIRRSETSIDNIQ